MVANSLDAEKHLHGRKLRRRPLDLQRQSQRPWRQQARPVTERFSTRSDCQLGRVCFDDRSPENPLHTGMISTYEYVAASAMGLRARLAIQFPGQRRPKTAEAPSPVAEGGSEHDCCRVCQRCTEIRSLSAVCLLQPCASHVPDAIADRQQAATPACSKPGSGPSECQPNSQPWPPLGQSFKKVYSIHSIHN